MSAEEIKKLTEIYMQDRKRYEAANRNLLAAKATLASIETRYKTALAELDKAASFDDPARPLFTPDNVRSVARLEAEFHKASLEAATADADAAAARGAAEATWKALVSVS